MPTPLNVCKRRVYAAQMASCGLGIQPGKDQMQISLRRTLDEVPVDYCLCSDCVNMFFGHLSREELTDRLLSNPFIEVTGEFGDCNVVDIGRAYLQAMGTFARSFSDLADAFSRTEG